MSLTITTQRAIVDDTDSVKDPLALTLMRQVQPQDAVTWDLFRTGSPIRQLKYEVASRSVSAREVVLENNFLTGDTDIDLNSATRKRVTDGHALYHPATKQVVILDEVNTTSGVCTIHSVQQAPSGSRTQIDAGETLIVLAQAEAYEQINAQSRFEETDLTTNYIQDTTELLEWSVAELREGRKWGIDQRRKRNERIRDVLRDLNMGLIYNRPVATDGDAPAMTAGFDYLVENGGNVVDADTSGTAKLSDPRGVLKTLQKNGVGPSDGLFAHMSVNVFHAYSDAGLDELQLTESPGSNFVAGNIMKGLNVPGIGFVPFLVDPRINDDRVRFICQSEAEKCIYQGENGPQESLRVVDEPTMGNSKKDYSSLQIKWGTNIRNADRAHYILDNTGLN